MFNNYSAMPQYNYQKELKHYVAVLSALDDVMGERDTTAEESNAFILVMRYIHAKIAKYVDGACKWQEQQHALGVEWRAEMEKAEKEKAEKEKALEKE